MSDKTKGYIWKAVIALAIIAVLVWAYKKFFSNNANLPKESGNSGIKYNTGLTLASNETITTVKPSDKPCAKTAGTCKGGNGTLFLTGSDSTGCHYGCYTLAQ